MKDKYCSRCKTILNLMPSPYSRTKRKSGKVYEYFLCNPCNTKRRREYYSTKNGKQKIREANTRYEASNPERKVAWGKSWNATKPCVVCGVKPVHRHHPDPHKPKEVIHLCPLHHRRVHRGMLLLGKLRNNGSKGKQWLGD